MHRYDVKRDAHVFPPGEESMSCFPILEESWDGLERRNDLN